MTTILTTVGTSLLGNAKRATGTDNPDSHALARFLKETDSAEASAETNSLSRLLKPGDRIVLLHSDTPDGEQCAAVLLHYYERTHDAVKEKIPKLDYRESGFKVQGLRSLVSAMARLIGEQRRAGHDVAINATGGFKAEIAYATLVGLLFDVPVYYIHEAFKDIIEMPATPIGWDLSLIDEHEEFFDWVDAELRGTQEVQSRLAALPSQIHLLLHEEDGFTMLSPMGEAYYEAFKQRLEQGGGDPVLLSGSARQVYDSLDPSQSRPFDSLFQRLAIRGLRRGGSEAVTGAACFVYPRRHVNERMFYTEDPDGTVRVLEIGRHSDKSYDAIYEGIQKRIKRGTYDDFQPLS